MDEREVRTIFFEEWSKRTDGKKDEAIAQTYFAVSVRIVAKLDVPDSTERYWETIYLALRLKTDLARKEMYPGPKDLSIVPFAGMDEPVVYRVLDAERDVLTYIARHLTTLPPSPFAKRHTKQSIELELNGNRREYDRIVRDYNIKQFTMIPRIRIEGLATSVDQLIEALLGVSAFNRFAEEFNAAQAVIRLEQDRPDGAVN